MRPLRGVPATNQSILSSLRGMAEAVSGLLRPYLADDALTIAYM